MHDSPLTIQDTHAWNVQEVPATRSVVLCCLYDETQQCALFREFWTAHPTFPPMTYGFHWHESCHVMMHRATVALLKSWHRGKFTACSVRVQLYTHTHIACTRLCGQEFTLFQRWN